MTTVSCDICGKEVKKNKLNKVRLRDLTEIEDKKVVGQKVNEKEVWKRPQYAKLANVKVYHRKYRICDDCM